MERKLLRPADLLLLLFALLLAGLLLWGQSQKPAQSCVAVIEEDGIEIRRIDLSTLTHAEEIPLGGAYDIVLLAEPGSISFQYSSCPDQTCVRTGKLTHAGQAAVCLPARISVRLEGGKQAADAMTG
ncbi:MAG TPA: NusG domain II-containing protein [Candidatus Caccousia stercoris]|uniref:NusG domain II-containing protein n=1 Tax=Candidatus Caccousia stercoris TaxID=2840723 RepID=A0A9D1K218_9FIRM|nr:NusG domain II-containing protein [Candidatus Caccousia stercoris]